MQASAAQGAAGGAPQLTEEQAERLVQAEAATARTLDAEVSFKFDVFVEETIYNLLGPYCLPYLLYRRGYTAAANRLYVGCQVMLVAQFLWSSGVILLNILHGMYVGTPGYPITTFEVIIANMLYLLRCMTVGVKYAFQSYAELAEMNAVRLPMSKIADKLVLRGWMAPSAHLLFGELERSLVRVSPAMCTHKVLYADAMDRDAMLWSMKECIPAYLQYEMGIHVDEEAEQKRAEAVKEATRQANEAAAALNAKAGATTAITAATAATTTASGAATVASTTTATPGGSLAPGAPGTTTVYITGGTGSESDKALAVAAAMAAAGALGAAASGTPAAAASTTTATTAAPAARASRRRGARWFCCCIPAWLCCCLPRLCNCLCQSTLEPSTDFPDPSAPGRAKDAATQQQQQRGSATGATSSDGRRRRRSGGRGDDDGDGESCWWMFFSACCPTWCCICRNNGGDADAMAALRMRMATGAIMGNAMMKGGNGTTDDAIAAAAAAAAGGVVPGGTGVFVPVRDDLSTEAIAVRRLIEILDGGKSYCEYDLQASLAAALNKSRGLPPATPGTPSAAGGGSGTATPTGSTRRGLFGKGKAGAGSSVSKVAGAAGAAAVLVPDSFLPGSAAVPTCQKKDPNVEHLPYIPAKLMAWFFAYESHIRRNPSMYGSTLASRIAGLIFAFLPFMIRSSLKYDPFGDTWASFLAASLTIFTIFTNFNITFQYVLVAPVDFARRLVAMAMLNASLDPMPAIATKFRLPKGTVNDANDKKRPKGMLLRPGGAAGRGGDDDAASAGDGDRGSELGDPTGLEDDDGTDPSSSIMTLMPTASMPMSALAMARANEVGTCVMQCQQKEGGDGIARMGSGTSSFAGRGSDMLAGNGAGARGGRRGAGMDGVPVVHAGAGNRHAIVPVPATGGATASAMASSVMRGAIVAPLGVVTGSPVPFMMIGDNSNSASVANGGNGTGAAELGAIVPAADLDAISQSAQRGGLIEGWLVKRALRKRGAFILGAGGWKSRYFVGDAAARTLAYGTGPGMPFIHTIRITEHCTVKRYRKRPFSFKVALDTSLNTEDGKKLVVAATNDEVVDTWIAFVQGMIDGCIRDKFYGLLRLAGHTEQEAIALAEQAVNDARATNEAAAAAKEAASAASKATAATSPAAASASASAGAASAPASAAASSAAVPPPRPAQPKPGRAPVPAAGTPSNSGSVTSAAGSSAATSPAPPPPAVAPRRPLPPGRPPSMTGFVRGPSGVIQPLATPLSAIATAGAAATPIAEEEDTSAPAAGSANDDPQAASASTPVASTSTDAAAGTGIATETAAAASSPGKPAKAPSWRGARGRTVRSSILARYRLQEMEAGAQGGANAMDGVHKFFMSILYGENLVSWSAVRGVCLDFGDNFKQRIQVYTGFFAVLCLVAIILLFFQFGQDNVARADQYIMIAMAAYGQVIFSIVLALSIVQGARLNDAATLHRFGLSRVETTVCSLLVTTETPGLANSQMLGGTSWRNMVDTPIQRQLRLTRQVASSLAQSLSVATAILPARVLFMPANYALLSTFWSLSVSGILSAVKTLKL